MHAEVQIYIPSRNYGRYISQALASVVSQTFHKWHCYIIDENSDDNTSEIALNFIEKFGNLKFTYIKNEKKVGLQKLSNWVFRNTQAPYVIRLDADDYWKPQLLEKLYTALKKNHKAALAFGGYSYVTESGEFLVDELSVNHLDRYRSGLDAPHGACTLVDRNKFISEGLYFEDVDAQDGWDLWMKCYPKYDFVALEESLFYYRQHNTSLSRNTHRIFSARRRLIGHNLNINEVNRVIAAIPVSKNLDLTSARVWEHLNNLLKKLNKSSYKIKPIIAVDDIEQLKVLERLEPNSDVLFTNGIFEYGMNPFKLLDLIQLKGDYKMWVNFNVKTIDTQLVNDALNTCLKFSLDNCVSVTEQREPAFKLTGEGLQLMCKGRYADYKLKADELWRMNNIFAISRMKPSISFDSDKTGYFEMSAEESILVHDW